MKSVMLSRFGGPEVLEVVDTARPVVRAGEVSVRVHAAGVNFFEALMRQNRYAVTPPLPAIFGVEVAGVVEEVGAGVTVKPGTRVAVPLFAIGRDGGYAEYVSAPAKAVVPLPDSVPFDVAVALLVQGLTALHSMRRSSPEGKTVLVLAAGGGVGTLLVQLAKRSGAKQVIAAASSEEKLALVRSLGADATVNYSKAEWVAECRDIAGGAGVDVVYDFVGGDLTATVMSALAPRGEVLFGALGRFVVDRAALDGMFERNQSLKGFALLPLLDEQTLRDGLDELFGLAVQERLRVIIGGRFALTAVADAHRLIEMRSSTGKVVLVP